MSERTEPRVCDEPRRRKRKSSERSADPRSRVRYALLFPFSFAHTFAGLGARCTTPLESFTATMTSAQRSSTPAACVHLALLSLDVFVPIRRPSPSSSASIHLWHRHTTVPSPAARSSTCVAARLTLNALREGETTKIEAVEAVEQESIWCRGQHSRSNRRSKTAEARCSDGVDLRRWTTGTVSMSRSLGRCPEARDVRCAEESLGGQTRGLCTRSLPFVLLTSSDTKASAFLRLYRLRCASNRRWRPMGVSTTFLSVHWLADRRRRHVSAVISE